MNSLEQGQLVYVPSGVTMIRYDKNHNPSHIFEIEKPTHFLLVRLPEDGEVGLHYDGDVWYTSAKDILPTSEERV
jgi:hypothetical protein